MSNANESNGFTLLELMVVLAIVAILVTIAAPSFTAMIQSNTMSTTVNTFLADFRYARSESIRRGGGVVMCRSDAPEIANPTCGTDSGLGNTGWATGWIIFHDLDKNKQRDNNEPLLRVQSPITSMNSIIETTGPTNSTETFQFKGNGRINPGSATTMQFGSLPQFKSEAQRKICISPVGRVRVAGDGSTAC